MPNTKNCENCTHSFALGGYLRCNRREIKEWNDGHAPTVTFARGDWGVNEGCTRDARYFEPGKQEQLFAEGSCV